MPLTWGVARHARESVRLVQVPGGDHPLARVQPDDLRLVRACPGEREQEQLPAEAAAALLRAQVHPLQLERVSAEVAQSYRSDDVAFVERDPQRRVRRGGIIEVAVERRIGLEAELAQRFGDERAESIRVA